MRITQTRMAIPIFVGIAFGIFFITSCTSTGFLNKSDNSSDESDREASLEEIQTQIEKDPDNSDLKIEKLEILFDIARNNPSPLLRQPYYRNMYDTAMEISYQSDSHSAEIDQKLNQAWSFEQGQGVSLLQQDETENFELHLNTIVAHFDNAITVQPDSMVTYTLKATTLYESGQIEDAIQTLEKAITTGDQTDLQIQEKLAYMHLEVGNLDRSIEIYKELALENFSDSNVQNGLVNAYVLNEQHEEAVEVLRELTETYPNQPEYQEALATELFFIFEKDAADFLANPGISQSNSENLLNLLREVDVIFSELQEKIPTAEEGTERMASFYTQAANTASDLANVTNGDIQNSFNQIEIDFYNQSLPLWLKLAELQPENIEYRENLYQLYLELDMEDEAQSIEQSLNF